MTRINVGVRPCELSDLHLKAEHREIKRIPNVILKGRYNLVGSPEEFTLGTGHVKFFYDKLGYLFERYVEIYVELRYRGFDVRWYGQSFINAIRENIGFANSFCPSVRDKLTVIRRIQDNVRKSGTLHTWTKRESPVWFPVDKIKGDMK